MVFSFRLTTCIAFEFDDTVMGGRQFFPDDTVPDKVMEVKRDESKHEEIQLPI